MNLSWFFQDNAWPLQIGHVALVVKHRVLVGWWLFVGAADLRAAVAPELVLDGVLVDEMMIVLIKGAM